MVTTLPIKKIVSTLPKRMSYRTPRHGYLPQSWLTSYAWSWFICPQSSHFLAIMPVLPSVMVVYSKSHGIFAKNQVISLSLVFFCPKSWLICTQLSYFLAIMALLPIIMLFPSVIVVYSKIMVYLPSFSCNHGCFAQTQVLYCSSTSDLLPWRNEALAVPVFFLWKTTIRKTNWSRENRFVHFPRIRYVIIVWKHWHKQDINVHLDVHLYHCSIEH